MDKYYVKGNGGNMNYQKIYDRLCSEDMEADYTEIHHIIPKSMGGDDSPENLVKLSGRAHYIAHLLLTKIYPDAMYLKQVIFLFSSRNKQINSRMYENNRKAFAETVSKRMTAENPMHNPESAKKMSATLKAKYESGEMIPRVIRDDEKSAISERMKGDGNPMRRFPEKNPFNGKSYVIGRQWVNNGTENLYLKEGEEIPEGYVKGMMYVPRGKWYNDGTVEKQFYKDDDIPSEFSKGRLK